MSSSGWALARAFAERNLDVGLMNAAYEQLCIGYGSRSAYDLPQHFGRKA